ncbi:MAG: hypothetical protein HY956_09665 [Deltaproteobacteria bacterium]|nr:hypothetical protein [Deltaproteobacteria bacterium]
MFMGRFKNKVLARLLTRFPALLDRFIEKTEAISVSGIPWTPVKKPLKDSVVALVTTAGVHLKSQKPFDMLDKDGDPTYREIPSATPLSEYMITHDYYDHADADRDLNIVFPIERLREMEARGEIKGLAKANYSFMGHIDGRHIATLIRKTAPEVAGLLKRESVDVALLTPG